jgi:uncharacterized protein
MPWDFWLIFLVLGVLIPWRGRARLQHLLAQPVGGTKEKLALYGSTMAFQWLLFAVVLWRSLAHGLTPAELGIGASVTSSVLLASATGAMVLGALQALNVRRISRVQAPVVDRMRKLAERLLPLKAVEFAPYTALVLTAGVCEEFLYRGFAMAAIGRVGLPSSLAVVISSVLFGLAHSYQGRSGVAGTTLLGILFGVFRVVYLTLLTVVVWHIAFDMAAGIAGPRYLLKNASLE